MNVSPLIISIIIFSMLLFILVAILVYTSRARKRREEAAIEVPETRVPSYQELKSILKNKNASYEALQHATDGIIEFYGDIEPKVGGRQSKDFDRYMELIFIICKHPNTDKKLVLNFERDLARMNPQYKKDLDHAVTKGLSFR